MGQRSHVDPGTFADKFEHALAEKRRVEPGYGLRTLARKLAEDDPERVETIRRRLNKYRPKPGGGAAEVSPTEPTRREIERALGLPIDSLAPDPSSTSMPSDLVALGRAFKELLAMVDA